MKIELSQPRRSFLSRLCIATGLLGVTFDSSSASFAQTFASGNWRPVRHPQDDWLDMISGKHRFVFDTNTPEGLALGLLFANNYYYANMQAYGLKESNLAVVVVVRHRATAFAFNDAMWSKYGKQLSEHSGFVDPTTKEPPEVNFYNTQTDQMPAWFDVLSKRGAHFAVCQMSAKTISYLINRDNGADQPKILEELNANVVSNAQPVAAGIVTVNRAQERGYSFMHAS